MKYKIRKWADGKWVASRLGIVYYTFPTWRAAMAFVDAVLTGRAR